MTHQAAMQAAKNAPLMGRNRVWQQAQEYSDTPSTHDKHGQQTPIGANNGDIAIAGCGQGGDREIEGINVIIDVWIDAHLQFIRQWMSSRKIKTNRLTKL